MALHEQSKFSFGPPPPPPQNSSPGNAAPLPSYQDQSFGQRDAFQNQRGRGGGFHRGRGDFHNPSSEVYGHFQRQVADPGYPPQGQYIGPQPPTGAMHQWIPQGQEQQGSSGHMQHQAASPPQNYYSNYVAPQSSFPYQTQPHAGYGPPQQHFQKALNAYNQMPPQQWQGPPQGHQGFESGRGRGRGGPNVVRGQSAMLMGPPIRMGFGADRPEDPVQASYPMQFQCQPQISPTGRFVQPVYPNTPGPTAFIVEHHDNAPHEWRPQQPFNQFNGHRPYGRGRPFGKRGNDHHDRGRGGSNRGYNDRFRDNHVRKNGDASGSNTIKQERGRSGVVPRSDEKRSNNKKKKRRKTNTLGLTPANEDHEASEEEDDEDEEARLATSALADVTSNMHISQDPHDMEAWLAERRAKWPTKARREAKDAELAQRRAQQAEQSARAKAENKQKHGNDTDDQVQKQQRKADKLRKQLERTEQKLQDAMKAGMKRKRGSNDSGDEKDGVVVKRESTLSSVSDMSDESESDEPDTATSRRTAPAKVLPPAKKTILDRNCKYFSTGGTCGKMGKCRFVHDQAVRDAALREQGLNGGRPTLQQRLMLADQGRDDLLVSKSIKYLGDHGVLDEDEMMTGTEEDSVEVDTIAETRARGGINAIELSWRTVDRTSEHSSEGDAGPFAGQE